MDKKTYSFKKFIESEIHKINEDKFYEGERISADPGEPFVQEWVKRNSLNWRNEWETSVCQYCIHWKICGHKVLKNCYEFKKDEGEVE